MLRTGERELVGEDGVAVPLSTGEYNLLLAFVTHPRRVLTRDQLLDLSQGRELGAFERSIDNHISRLRRKIEADPSDPEADQDGLGRRLHARRRGQAAVRRLLPKSLVGQMALLIGAALLVAQVVNFALLFNERQQLSRAQIEAPAITRFTSAAADFVQAAPSSSRSCSADASRRGARYELGAAPSGRAAGLPAPKRHRGPAAPVACECRRRDQATCGRLLDRHPARPIRDARRRRSARMLLSRAARRRPLAQRAAVDAAPPPPGSRPAVGSAPCSSICSSSARHC